VRVNEFLEPLDVMKAPGSSFPSSALHSVHRAPTVHLKFGRSYRNATLHRGRGECTGSMHAQTPSSNKPLKLTPRIGLRSRLNFRPACWKLCSCRSFAERSLAATLCGRFAQTNAVNSERRARFRRVISKAWCAVLNWPRPLGLFDARDDRRLVARFGWPRH